MKAGTCRFCHCTEDDACTLPNGDPCAWITVLRTVCSNPRCLMALYTERQRHENKLREAINKAARAPWPSQIRRERRRNAKKRAKGRAA